MEIFMYILRAILVILNILKSIFDGVKAYHKLKRQDEKKEDFDPIKDKSSK